jgi:nucleoside-diphosphate-sugar epimerase
MTSFSMSRTLHGIAADALAQVARAAWLRFSCRRVEAVMRAFVTGGGGFLGGALVRALRARGDEVTSFARGDYPALKALGVTHVRGDIADRDTLARAMNGHDVVFHVAALVQPFGNPKDFDRVNIDGTRNVTEAMASAGIETLVFTSTPSVIHDGHDARGIDESKPYPAQHMCDYFRTKAAAEVIVREANGRALDGGKTLRTTCLRPHGVFGPGDTSLMPLLIARAKAGRLRIIGDGDTKVDWCYVDNATDAHLLAADALRKPPYAPAGRVYFIANDEPVNPWAFFNDILAKLSLPTVARKVPLGLAVTAGGLAEGAWSLFGLKGEPPGTRAMASVLGTSHWFDLSAAKRDLGWTPRVKLDDGVAQTVPYLRRMLDEGKL